jgi:hypothetical protein
VHHCTGNAAMRAESQIDGEASAKHPPAQARIPLGAERITENTDNCHDQRIASGCDKLPCVTQPSPAHQPAMHVDAGAHPASAAHVPLHLAIDLTDILSLTEFQRGAKQHINRLRKTGKAQVLTINGSASLVVQDARSYQRLLDEIAALRETLATRSSLIAARIDAPHSAALSRDAEVVVKPTQLNARTLAAMPAASRQSPKDSAAISPTSPNEPAGEGLARALAQLRQQLAGPKGP